MSQLQKEKEIIWSILSEANTPDPTLPLESTQSQSTNSDQSNNTDPQPKSRHFQQEQPLDGLQTQPSQLDPEVTVEDIMENLSNRWWRINHLYYIKDKNANKILFKPEDRPYQKELHDNFWYFTIIPKARQLGITTFYTILYLDAILFSENKTACIIAHKQEDMRKIFRDKVKFAWDHLHPWLKQHVGQPNTNNANELVFPNGSSISVSTSTRSGTVQYLHISEFGYICQKAPEKAEEIVTGSLNSVHVGNIVSIESTAAGKEGYFYEFCMEAERAQKENRTLTPMDFKLFFFPWFLNKEYVLPGNVLITKEQQEYFTRLLTKHNISLTTEQQNWYVKKSTALQDKMFQEYPSTLEEAFSASIDGAFYQREMSKVFSENRIRPVLHDPMYEVDTWWDLGMNDFTVILLTQTINQKIHFIDMYWNNGMPLSHYYGWLKERKDQVNYRYGTHNLPHDVEVKELSSGVSRKQTLYQLGMRNIRVGTKVPLQDGIERVRQLFRRFVFDDEKCKKLHESLFNYRREFDDKLGVHKDKPRHDENSHFADPVRLLAELWKDKTSLLEETTTINVEQAFFG